MKPMRCRWLVLALAALLRPAVAAEEPYSGVKNYDYQDRTAVEAVRTLIREAQGDAARLGEIETRLVGLLQDPATTLGGKQEICRLLWVIGTARSVPALATMLADANLTDMARFALERNPDASAGTALLDALGKVSGPPLVGVINSLGARREAAAVPALTPLAKAADEEVAQAALLALGRIGTPDAVAVLEAQADKTPVVCEGLLNAAAVAMQAGRTADAQKLYESLAGATMPANAQIAALRGLAACDSPQALPAALAALSSPTPAVQRAAARLAALVKDPTATAKFIAAYADLPVDTQVVVLTALADRGDAAAASLAVDGLTSQDATLRQAAIRAAAVLGGAGAVGPLAAVAARGDRGDRQLAHDQLAIMPGRDAEAALLDLAGKGEADVRAEAISVLAARGATGAVPLLLTAVKDGDAGVAKAAWKALGDLAGAEQQGQLVTLMVGLTDEDVQATAQAAIIAAARRLDNRDAALAPVFAALPAATVPNKVVLLGVACSLGGEKSLAELILAAGSDDADLKRGAIDLLANGWEDSRPLGTLLDIAKNDPNNGLRSLALRGYLRLLGQDGRMKGEDKVARLAEAMDVAQKPDQKKQVLGVLRVCRVEAAVAMAARYLDDAELGEEAADTILYLAAQQRRDNRNLAAVRGMAVREAVMRIREKRGEGLPRPWYGEDVGGVGKPGEAALADGTWTVKASGDDIWGTADGCYLVTQVLSGDATIVARVVSVQETNVWAKAGVIFRASADADAANVVMCITPGNNASFQRRPKAGAESVYNGSGGNIKAPYWVRLVRAGNLFTGYISADGKEWQKVAEDTVPLPKDALVGLALTSHDNGKVTTAVIDSVEISH